MLPLDHPPLLKINKSSTVYIYIFIFNSHFVNTYTVLRRLNWTVSGQADI